MLLSSPPACWWYTSVTFGFSLFFTMRTNCHHYTATSPLHWPIADSGAPQVGTVCTHARIANSRGPPEMLAMQGARINPPLGNHYSNWMKNLQKAWRFCPHTKPQRNQKLFSEGFQSASIINKSSVHSWVWLAYSLVRLGNPTLSPHWQQHAPTPAFSITPSCTLLPPLWGLGTWPWPAAGIQYQDEHVSLCRAASKKEQRTDSRRWAAERRGKQRAGRAVRLFLSPRSAAVCGSPSTEKHFLLWQGFFCDWPQL